MTNINTQGILPEYFDELAVTGSASPLSVGIGGAVVAGYPYENTSAVSVVVPTPTIGTTGHRVVLRWAGAADTIRITLLSSSNGVSTIPALTQTTTVWEISLAQVSITTGGAITISDDRTFVHVNTMLAGAHLDNLSVTGGKLAPDSVDTTKAGAGMPQLTNRQGGSATDWGVAGTTAQVPGAVRMQTGVVDITLPAGSNLSQLATVTYPVPFTGIPIVVASIANTSPGEVPNAIAASAATQGETPSNTVFTVMVGRRAGFTAAYTVRINWIAIGAE